jgi:hypothetical protein
MTDSNWIHACAGMTQKEEIDFFTLPRSIPSREGRKKGMTKEKERLP